MRYFYDEGGPIEDRRRGLLFWTVTAAATCLFAISCAEPVSVVPPTTPQPTIAAIQSAPSAPLATANTADISRVTNDSMADLGPRPSPDGKSILFTTADASKPQDPNEPKPAGVFYSVVQIDLANVGRKLVAGPYACEPTWSPNGIGSFVYVYLRLKKQQIVKTPDSGSGMTFVSQSALGDQDEVPDVSPDGKRVVFMTPIGPQTMICTVGIDGTDFTTYVEGYMPRWAPDGYIYFCSDAGGAAAITEDPWQWSYSNIWRLRLAQNAIAPSAAVAPHGP